MYPASVTYNFSYDNYVSEEMSAPFVITSLMVSYKILESFEMCAIIGLTSLMVTMYLRR